MFVKQMSYKIIYGGKQTLKKNINIVGLYTVVWIFFCAKKWKNNSHFGFWSKIVYHEIDSLLKSII